MKSLADELVMLELRSKLMKLISDPQGDDPIASFIETAKKLLGKGIELAFALPLPLDASLIVRTDSNDAAALVMEVIVDRGGRIFSSEEIEAKQAGKRHSKDKMRGAFEVSKERWEVRNASLQYMIDKIGERKLKGGKVTVERIGNARNKLAHVAARLAKERLAEGGPDTIYLTSGDIMGDKSLRPIVDADDSRWK